MIIPGIQGGCAPSSEAAQTSAIEVLRPQEAQREGEAAPAWPELSPATAPHDFYRLRG